MNYRKKPVVVEAQLFGSIDQGARLAAWCGGSNEISPEQIQIPTLEGVMTASLGDWIIKGGAGEFYPCKADIFDATYEPEW